MLEIKRRDFDTSYEGIRIKAVANLLYLMVNIYGLPKAKKNLKKKLDGKELAVNLPALGGSIIFKVSGERLVPYIGSPENAKASFSIRKKDEIKALDIIEDVIKTPGTNFGLIKLIFKYLLTRKASIGGSLGAVITFLKTIMIGKHKMYKIARNKGEVE